MSESVRHVIREIYCEVLFELAEEGGAIDRIQDDLARVVRVLEQEPEFAAILNNPTIHGAEKSESIRRVFKGYVSDLTLDFLSVLARRNRIALLAGIAARYEMLVDRHHDRQEIEVTVPAEPTPEQVEHLREQLQKAVKSEVKLSITVDEDIIGGILIKKDDMLIDNTIKTALERAARAVSQSAKVRIQAARPERKEK